MNPKTISRVMSAIGSIKSARKAAASARNGKKGGRPRVWDGVDWSRPIEDIAAERGVSVRSAQQIRSRERRSGAALTWSVCRLTGADIKVRWPGPAQARLRNAWVYEVMVGSKGEIVGLNKSRLQVKI